MAGLAAATAMSCGDGFACVARGTRVSTPTGPRRVEDFAIGDALITVDPLTGESAVTHVTHIRSAQRECGALTFGDSALTVTSDHPLFDPQTRRFHPAGDWLTGARTRLLAFEGERTRDLEVAAHQRFVAVSQVFDLTVEHAWHTFVAEGIVVHNKQPPPCALPDGRFISVGISAEACTCSSGPSGVWSCPSGGTAVCARCGAAQGDGGTTSDAGP